MSRTIGESADLSGTLNEFVFKWYLPCKLRLNGPLRIMEEAYGAFYNTVEAQCRSLARTILVSINILSI